MRSPLHRRAATLLVTAALAALAPVGAQPAAAEDITEVCRFPAGVLPEISGMTYSQRHPGVLWVHNDSGGGPVIYALDSATCQVRATVRVSGIEARDLEAIASGRDRRGRPVLWLGDIGDNRSSWPEVRLHRIREPRILSDRTVESTTFRFTYADRPHDAEALLADPASSQVWVVTKQLARGRLYALPGRPSPDTVNIATPVRREGALITDGAVSPDGSRYVLRDYVDAEVFSGLPPGRRAALVYLPVQLQGEAVTWTTDGTALLVASEGDRRLLRVEIDANTAPSATSPEVEPAATAVSEAPDSAEADGADPTLQAGEAPPPAGTGPSGSALAAALVLTVSAAAILAVVERRRRRAPGEAGG